MLPLQLSYRKLLGEHYVSTDFFCPLRDRVTLNLIYLKIQKIRGTGSNTLKKIIPLAFSPAPYSHIRSGYLAWNRFDGIIIKDSFISCQRFLVE